MQADIRLGSRLGLSNFAVLYTGPVQYVDMKLVAVLVFLMHESFNLRLFGYCSIKIVYFFFIYR